jgi:HTH-type transcriptional regulator/antitoxin HigA
MDQCIWPGAVDAARRFYTHRALPWYHYRYDDKHFPTHNEIWLRSRMQYHVIMAFFGFLIMRTSSRSTGSCSTYEATHIGWWSQSISRKGSSGSNGSERIAIMTGSTSERSTLSEIKPIRREEDYEEALTEVERLWGARSGTPEGDRLDVLATLIDAYESAHHPIDPPDPIEAIKFRMEQQGLTRKDLEGILGSRTRIAEVLNRRRGLSINMIRRLHNKLGISAEVLIRPSRTEAV